MECEVYTAMEVEEENEVEMEVDEISLGKFDIFQLGFFTGSISILLEKEASVAMLSSLLEYFKYNVLYHLLANASPVFSVDETIRKRIVVTARKNAKIWIRLIINFDSRVSTFQEIERVAIQFVQYVTLNSENMNF